MTRIAGSDPALWTEILTWNAERVHSVLTEVIEDLQGMSASLSASSTGGGGSRSSGVGDVLSRGVQGRERIPGKHGGSGRDYEVVSVLVKDEPGELASLFVAAGDLGINLEDVRIEHVLGRPSGLIDLSVRPQFAQQLREGLAEGGFDVRA
jgi:prephenate dehydrogenase